MLITQTTRLKYFRIHGPSKSSFEKFDPKTKRSRPYIGKRKYTDYVSDLPKKFHVASTCDINVEYQNVKFLLQFVLELY